MSRLCIFRLSLLTNIILLSSCSSEIRVDVLDDYLDRLSKVVNVERVESEHFLAAYRTLGQSLRFPISKQGIYDAQSEQAIGLLDFLSLYGCRLQTLVAERNSNLGKVARPSQKLIYELEFIKYSPECIEQLLSEGGEELANQLLMVSRQKKQALARHIWQAILNGEEASVFWKQAHSLGSYPEKETIYVLNSLNALESVIGAWLSGNFAEDFSSLEQYLASLNQPEGGALLQSLLLYSMALNEANKLLDRARLCHKGRPLFNPIAAQNVVTKFFVGRVQIWASQLSQRYYALMPAYRKLEEQLEFVQSAEYEKWRRQRDEQFELSINASQDHVQRLEVLLNGCVKKNE